jgi:hypothetical protein
VAVQKLLQFAQKQNAKLAKKKPLISNQKGTLIFFGSKLIMKARGSVLGKGQILSWKYKYNIKSWTFSAISETIVSNREIFSPFASILRENNIGKMKLE